MFRDWTRWHTQILILYVTVLIPCNVVSDGWHRKDMAYVILMREQDNTSIFLYWLRDLCVGVVSALHWFLFPTVVLPVSVLMYP